MTGRHPPWIHLFLVGLAVILLLRSGSSPGTNESAHLATVDSLVHRGTFAIDGSRFRTVDQVERNGKRYSSKPRLLAVVLSVPYFLMAWVGLSFESNPGLAIRVLVVLGSIVPLLLTCFAVQELLSRSPTSFPLREITFVGFGLGSLNFAYAATLNHHVIASACLAWAMALQRRQEEEGRVRRPRLVGTSALAGASMAFDPVAGLLALAVLASGAWRSPRSSGFFLLGLAVPSLAFLLVQTREMGSFLPSFHPEMLKTGAKDSYWDHPVGIDASQDPPWLRLLNTTIGHHGLFLVCPFVLAALGALRPKVIRTLNFSERVQALALIITFVAVALWGSVYGGLCFGPRYFTVGVPFAFILAARSISYSLSGWSSSAAAIVLLLPAVLQAGIATGEPWVIARSARLLPSLGLTVLAPP